VTRQNWALWYGSKLLQINCNERVLPTLILFNPEENKKNENHCTKSVVLDPQFGDSNKYYVLQYNQTGFRK
jgi:hypothetical protein